MIGESVRVSMAYQQGWRIGSLVRLTKTMIVIQVPGGGEVRYRRVRGSEVGNCLAWRTFIHPKDLADINARADAREQG